MRFVCLWSPGWETAGDELVELAATLLAQAPRVAVGEGVLWADARGLPGLPLARALRAELAAAGAARARAGVAAVPVVAEAAARSGERPVTPVAAGGERSFLAPLSLALLRPERRLAALLRGAGIRRCGELAALPREPVEVRFGAEGAALWRLARGDDPRLLFTPIPPERPHAGLDWPDTVVRDAARLAFALNALLGPVCGALAERGERAGSLVLELALEGGGTLRREVRTARPTADRSRWLTRLREELERLALPDGVVGVALRAGEAARSTGAQGDLFDRGFATAAPVEEAVARLLDAFGAAVLVAEGSAHPLAEQRTAWRMRDPAGVAAGGSASPAMRAGLTLQLLAEPRSVAVRTRPRRDHLLPTAYRDGGAWHALPDAAGPERVSGGHDGEAFAREYFRCVSDQGRLVWLFRDARSGGWFLHGWWD